jgi:hypothetical protein
VLAIFDKHLECTALRSPNLIRGLHTMGFSTRRLHQLGFCLLASSAVACADTPAATGVDSRTQALHSAAQGGDWTIDDEFEATAREIPGFAGQYLDANGHPVVRLVDLSQRAAAERRVRAQRAAQGLANVPVTVRQARYDFVELRQFQDRLAPLMLDDHVFAVDVDEAENRVWLAAETARDAATARAAAARLGVPQDAFVVEVQGKPARRQTLADAIRPVQGGLQIVNATTSAVCTLGFNAVLNGTSVFITNSHCSSSQFAVDGSVHRQPSNDPGLDIGYEVVDPKYTSCTYSTTVVPCRRADAAAFTYYSTTPSSVGRIARTLGYGAGQPGSRDIDPANPTFQVTSKNMGGLPVGASVDKMGAVSGWTRGQVTRSCVWLKQTIFWKCQYVSSTWSQKGDSGSPMFVVWSGGVVLQGILWGGPEDDFSTTWYSPIAGIENDFNATLTVF